jgi:hypothetical protein
MSIVGGIALWIAGWIGVSAVARTAAGARLAPLLALAALPLPWIVRAPYPLRVMLAFALACLLISAVDFAAGRCPPTFAGRLAYVLGVCALIDSTTAVRVHRHFEWDATRRIAIELFAAALATAGWIAAYGLPSPLRIPIRLVALAALVLVVAELHSHIARLVSAACGVRFDAVHRQPYRSRTITEFWSRRWNLFGARWFRQHTFQPLRARGVTFALFTLFAVSAVIHVYLIASVVPVRWMAMCAAFFVSQPVLIVIERRLRVRTWPPHAGRVWTFSLFIALLPLLLAPLLAALQLAL